MILLGLVPLPVSTAVPFLDNQDDAGSGEDAPDTAPFSIPLGPGAYEGELLDLTDLADLFSFNPPRTTVFRLEGEVGEVTLEISDPTGRVRACGYGPGLMEYSIIIERAGPWQLQFDRGNCGGFIGPSPINPFAEVTRQAGYAFEVSFELHENFVSFDVGEGLAHTVITQFPGRFARVELLYESIEDVSIDPYAFSYYTRVQGPGIGPAHGGSGLVATPFAGVAKPHVWTYGLLPGDLDLGLPPVPALTTNEVRAYAETRLNLTLHLGIAFSAGLRMRGVAVWDGPGFSVQVVEGSVAEFNSLRDFEAEGPAMQVGPYVKMDQGSASFVAGSANVLFARGRLPLIDPFLPPPHFASTRLTVTDPTGQEMDLTGSADFWIGGGPLSGNWRADVRDVDGLWGDTIVFFGTSFPIPYP